MTEEYQAPKFEELLERFQAKVAAIPADCYEAIMYWHMAREIQTARIAAENRLGQVVKIGKKVFYADGELPEHIKVVMAKGDAKHFDELRKAEGLFTRNCEKAFKTTRWYNEVARPAAENIGLGPLLAGELLWTIGSASRFETFGKIVRYAGLDVTREGKAPKRAKGQRITWNPKLRTALFKLTEGWLKVPESIWRARWDGWKAWYAENRPEVLEEKGGKGHIHNMARRKIQREFLRNLWTLWAEFEE